MIPTLSSYTDTIQSLVVSTFKTTLNLIFHFIVNSKVKRCRSAAHSLSLFKQYQLCSPIWLRPQNSNETALINATNYLLLATDQGSVSSLRICTEAKACSISSIDVLYHGLMIQCLIASLPHITETYIYTVTMQLLPYVCGISQKPHYVIKQLFLHCIPGVFVFFYNSLQKIHVLEGTF